MRLQSVTERYQEYISQVQKTPETLKIKIDFTQWYPPFKAKENTKVYNVESEELEMLKTDKNSIPEVKKYSIKNENENENEKTKNSEISPAFLIYKTNRRFIRADITEFVDGNLLDINTKVASYIDEGLGLIKIPKLFSEFENIADFDSILEFYQIKNIEKIHYFCNRKLGTLEREELGCFMENVEK